MLLTVDRSDGVGGMTTGVGGAEDDSMYVDSVLGVAGELTGDTARSDTVGATESNELCVDGGKGTFAATSTSSTSLGIVGTSDGEYKLT